MCNLLALFMGAYCFVRSIVVYHLVMDELNADDSSNVPESKRFTGFKDRVVTLLLTVVTLGPVVILFLIVFKDDVSAIAYAVGSIGNLCAAYFDACTSPPKKRRMAMRSLSSQNQ